MKPAKRKVDSGEMSDASGREGVPKRGGVSKRGGKSDGGVKSKDGGGSERDGVSKRGGASGRKDASGRSGKSDGGGVSKDGGGSGRDGVSKRDASGEETRHRLLDAAEEVFAERGYSAASVRDMTSLAGCNIAGVNYHFGGKKKLYEHVFHRLLGEMRERRIEAVESVREEAEMKKDCAMVIRAFAEAFVEPLVTEPKRGAVRMQLFMREMAHPHLPGEMIVREMIEPVQRMMIHAIKGSSQGLSTEAAMLCMHTLVGQLVHVLMARGIFERAGIGGGAMADMKTLIDHIVRVTAAGVHSYQEHDDGA